MTDPIHNRLMKLHEQVRDCIEYTPDKEDERNDVAAMVEAFYEGLYFDGDCEEYARLERALLEPHFPEAEFWLVHGKDRHGYPHAWLEMRLIVGRKCDIYRLDSQHAYIGKRQTDAPRKPHIYQGRRSPSPRRV